jgi:hypothetical protein
MLKLISTIVAAVKSTSLATKIIGVVVLVVLAGGGAAAIIIASNNDNAHDTQTTEDATGGNEQIVDGEDQAAADGEMVIVDAATEPDGESQSTPSTPSPASNSASQNKQSQPAQSTTPNQPTTPAQPSTPKPDYNLNNNIEVNHILGITCLRFNEETQQDEVVGERPGFYTFNLEGEAYEAYSRYCPEGSEPQVGGHIVILDETICSIMGISCGRW